MNGDISEDVRRVERDLGVTKRFTIQIAVRDMAAAARAADQMADGFRRGLIPASGCDPVTGFIYQTQLVRQ